MNPYTSRTYDYYPFGMVMPGRTFTSSGGEYRFGFNGKEKDSEGMGGGGSTYDYGFRIYNPQLGKFLSLDPLMGTYPMLTPYQFASNTPIVAIDLDGLEAEINNLAVTCTSDESVIHVSADIEIKIKVLDVSNLSFKNLQTVYSKAEKKFEEILNSTDGQTYLKNQYIDYEGNSLTGVDFSITTDVNFSLSFTSIESTSEIQNEDFVILLVDNPLEKTVSGRSPEAYVIAKGENITIMNIGSDRLKALYSDYLNGGGQSQEFADVMTHEILHMLGLADEYTEDASGTTVKPGMEFNVMGNSSANGITKQQIATMVHEILQDNSFTLLWKRKGVVAFNSYTKQDAESTLEQEGVKYE